MPPRTRRTPLESDERSSDSPLPVPDQRRHHRGRHPSTSSTRYTQSDPYYDQRYADRYWTYGQDGQPQYPIHANSYRPDGYPPDIPWAQPLPQTRISDTTLFLAVLFGASIGNITARPTLIIFLWLAYAFYSFLGDVHYTLAQRRYRLEQTAGPFGTQIILAVFKAFAWVGGFMMFLGL